jgi:hypothetical protein
MCEMSVLGLMASCLLAFLAEVTDTAQPDTPSVPAAMRFEPRWRYQSDCGVTSLFVLMRLLGIDRTIEEVERSIDVDPNRGSSLETLVLKSRELGLPANLRFVTPSDLPLLQGPYIAHCNGSLVSGVGHFLVVVDYAAQQKQYAVINTDKNVFEWIPSHALIALFSGYVLIPEKGPDDGHRRVTGLVLIAATSAAALAMYRFGTSSLRVSRKPSVRSW